MNRVNADGELDQHAYVEMQAALQAMTTLAVGFDAEEIAAFIRTGEHSLAIAPFLDPTAYMRGADRLEDVMTCARALRDFVKAIEPVRAKHMGGVL